jgi:uncharacterized membrane protein
MEPGVSPTDRLLDKLGYVALAFLWIYTAISYSPLPATIPTHFNWKGEVDGYGSKELLWIIPVIVTIIVSIFSFIKKNPDVMNKYSYPKRELTPEEFERRVQLSTRLLRTMQLSISIVFNIITFEIVRAVSNRKSDMSFYTIPGLIIMMMIPVGIYIYKMNRK